MVYKKELAHWVTDELWEEVVFKAPNDLWYFWDETWGNKIGPYPNYDTAQKAAVEYARKL